ncbi:hypothetical protein [Hominenteromicrobium sp.]|uniref:hypothetical protein n=1 Tax=Hominenteromicrobium sp. TaxID=3073581 RepID=UPI003AF16CE5
MPNSMDVPPGLEPKWKKTGHRPFYKRAFMPLKSVPEIRRDFSNMKSTLQGQKALQGAFSMEQAIYFGSPF